MRWNYIGPESEFYWRDRFAWSHRHPGWALLAVWVGLFAALFALAWFYSLVS